VAEASSKYAMKVTGIAIARRPGYFRNALSAFDLILARQQHKGMAESKRLNTSAACGSSTGEQLLQVSKRNACFSRDFGRANIWICKMSFSDAANTLKELVAVRRCMRLLCRSKERADQTVHDDVNSGLAFSKGWIMPCELKNLQKQLGCQAIGPTHSKLGFATKVGNTAGSRNPKRKEAPSARYGAVLHGTRSIEEDDVAWFRPHNTSILRHIDRAKQLLPDQKMIGPIALDILLRSLDRRGVAAHVGSFDSPKRERSHPPNEGPLIIVAGIVPPTRRAKELQPSFKARGCVIALVHFTMSPQTRQNAPVAMRTSAKPKHGSGLAEGVDPSNRIGGHS
jgi:hypothetical protein